MEVRSRIGRTLERIGHRWASKASPRLPSFGGGVGAEWQWTELARELRRMFDANAKGIDYSTIDPGMNRVVQMCMSTIVLASARSRIRVSRRTDTGVAEDRGHGLSRLLARPNDYLTTGELLATTRTDLARGNAYWWKERDGRGTGEVVGLWMLPRPFVRARWPVDGSEFLSFYEMWTGYGWQRLERRDVIHFRRKLDHSPGFDGRYGEDPLRYALREVAIDERASDWAAVLLRNQGVPGAIISPKGLGGKQTNMSYDQIKDRVQAFQSAYTGENRGQVMIATLALDVQKLGFNPAEINFEEQHDLVESTVCGLLDVPAGLAGVKVGVRAGMAKANSEEDTDRLWMLNLLPQETWIGERAARDLLPEFDETEPDHIVDFDHSEVEALRENLKEAADVADTLYKGGVVSRRRAQALARQEVDETTPDVYCIPPGVMVYEVGTSPVEAQAAARPVPMPGDAAEDGADAADADDEAASIEEAVKALSPEARRALKAALETAENRAVAFWRESSTPGMRELLAAVEPAA